MTNKARPNWLDENEYPFKDHYFSTPYGDMHYVDEGTGDPIVFVHGNLSWSFEARNVIKALSGQYRCIAVDYLGLGLSDKPADYSYLPEDLAKHLEALLESLNLQRITMVVADWGGPIGLSYAIRHPEKIKSIVITNSWLWSLKKELYYQAFSGFMGGPVGRWLNAEKNFFAKNMGLLLGDKSKLTPNIHKHYVEQFPTPAERKSTWVFPEQIIGASDWLESMWNQRHVLNDKIALIAWGEKDIAMRAPQLQTWMREFPKARVMRFPNSAHYIVEENPAELAEAIKNLNSNQSK
ncbi:MAG: alpha/beta fold hydrolase [Chloroflexota bacterium]|mgnify:CR=1 FL=1